MKRYTTVYPLNGILLSKTNKPVDTYNNMDKYNRPMVSERKQAKNGTYFLLVHFYES